MLTTTRFCSTAQVPLPGAIPAAATVHVVSRTSGVSRCHRRNATHSQARSKALAPNAHPIHALPVPAVYQECAPSYRKKIVWISRESGEDSIRNATEHNADVAAAMTSPRFNAMIPWISRHANLLLTLDTGWRTHLARLLRAKGRAALKLSARLLALPTARLAEIAGDSSLDRLVTHAVHLMILTASHAAFPTSDSACSLRLRMTAQRWAEHLLHHAV